MAARKKSTTAETTTSGGGIAPQEREMVKAARQFIQGKMGLKPVALDVRNPYIPSGSILVDHAIGGQLSEDGKGPVCPGYPRTRIVEIYGPEASGKTTATLHAIAEAQKGGGRCCFLDFEHALDINYAKKLGVSFDEDQLLFYRPSTIEDGFKIMNVAIQMGYDLIVVDSVPALITKAELEKGLDENDRIGSIAGALASKLRKLVIWLDDSKKTNPRGGTCVIFINQVRDNIGGGGKGPDEKTPGGRALKFFTSLRLRFGGIGSAFIKRKNSTGKEISIPYGVHTRVKVIKNKMSATNGQTTDIFIRHGEGYDNVHSLIESGIFYKAIKKSGSWLNLGEQRFQGKDQLRKHLLATPTDLTALRDLVLSSIYAGQAVAGGDDEEPATESEILMRNLEASVESDGDESDEDMTPEEDEEIASDD
jgi:recombination protein RecA